jgi:hypothetical protein
VTASGADASFILKLDDTGNFVWAKAISGTSTTLNFDIAVDDAGNVFVGGEFWGTCDFDPGTAIQNKTAFGFSSDAYLLKLNASGNFEWVAVFTGNEDQWAKAIEIDNNGDVAVCGGLSKHYRFRSRCRDL